MLGGVAALCCAALSQAAKGAGAAKIHLWEEKTHTSSLLSKWIKSFFILLL